MSWSKVINLECDRGEHGCMSTPEHAEYEETVPGARATAEKNGWQHDDGQDIYPICIYVHETGCTCDVQLHEGGKVVRLEDARAIRDCKVHCPAARRNPIVAKWL